MWRAWDECALEAMNSMQDEPQMQVNLTRWMWTWTPRAALESGTSVRPGIFAAPSADTLFWKCRNGVIFYKKTYTDPVSLIEIMCHWIVGWSILQTKKQNRDMLELGTTKLLERVENDVYKASQCWRNSVMRLGGWWWPVDALDMLLRSTPSVSKLIQNWIKYFRT